MTTGDTPRPADVPALDRPIAGIRAPDSRIAREAHELARRVSSPMLFNHVMRSYYLGRLVAGDAGEWDDEVVFLSAVLHDLGLTDRARGERRFEIEGADAARQFLSDAGLEPAMKVHLQARIDQCFDRDSIRALRAEWL